MASEKKDKKKDVTLPSDFVDGRKGLQDLSEWGSDYLQRLEQNENRNIRKDR